MFIGPVRPVDKQRKQMITELQQKIKSQKDHINKLQQMKPTKRPKQPKKDRIIAQLRNQIRLMDCTYKYAKCLVDPFGEEARAACLPLNSVGSSWKVTAKTVFTMTIGTGLIGFVAVGPSFCNDINSYSYSTTGFTTSAIATQTTTGVVLGTMTALPFTAAQATGASSTVAGRIVGVGCRITYSGSVLNMGGMMYSLVPTDRRNLDGANIAALTANNMCALVPVTQKSFTEVMYGVNDVERQYSDENLQSLALQYWPLGNGQGDSTDEIPFPAGLGIIVSGASGTQYTVELIYHVEYTGRDAAFAATSSEEDVVGVSHVLSKVGKIALERLQDPTVQRAVYYNGMKAAKMVSDYMTSTGNPITRAQRRLAIR